MSESQLQVVQAQVQETTEIMRNNIEKAIARDNHLQDAEDKSEQLLLDSRRFQRGATRLKRIYQCSNVKYALIIGTIVVILLVVLVVIVAKS